MIKMVRNNSLKLLAIIMVTLLLVVDSVYSFLAPSTIQLLMNTASNLLYYLIIIVSGLLVTFFLKIKKNIKLILIIFFMCILVLLFINAINYHNEIQSLNEFGPSYIDNESMKEFISNIFQQSKQYLNTNYTNHSRFMSETYNIEKYNLTNITLNDWKSKTIIRLTAIDIYFDAKILSYTKILRFAETGNLTDYLTRYNISKRDELIVICDSGMTSSVIATILNMYGYNAKYLPSFEILDQKVFSEYYNYQEDYRTGKIRFYPFDEKKLQNSERIYFFEGGDVKIFNHTSIRLNNFKEKNNVDEKTLHHVGEDYDFPKKYSSRDMIVCPSKWDCIRLYDLIGDYEVKLYAYFDS